jgi:uncharacterized protein (DUF1684 family)|nr:DUF1684 domain-containing protein [Candidatus Krumholzibacteria bacterium]
MTRRFLSLTLLILTVVGCSSGTDPEYIAEVDAWHAARVTRLKADDGWLTLVGLHPLHEGSNRLGGADGEDVQLAAGAPAKVGTITVAPDQILFAAQPGVTVLQAGEQISTAVLLTDDPGPPSVLETGSLLFYVIRRGDQLFLRVKDRNAEALQSFTGIDRFPVESRWLVTARLEPGAATTQVPNVLGQVDEVPSPGVLVFKVAGRECRLTPQGEAGQGLFLVFGDQTNGHTTYGGGRFLSTDPIAEDGTVILDFNRAYNPPCVFSPYATCPLPSVDNLLDVAVEAGEMMWGETH